MLRGGSVPMPKLVLWLLAVVGPPVAAWVQTQVFGRFPAAPFLELMPARTAIGRSLSMTVLALRRLEALGQQP